MRFLWSNRNYDATIWRQITINEYAEYALSLDVHSSNKFRVNAVLPQFQKFYDTYRITENMICMLNHGIDLEFGKEI
ncbi:MAG: hypothetical protein LLF98_10920 [Clostridium sp.]|uniref:M13-type metalloendopeptidase n=1 Tax=Clostridium sp. TaxID=1506 RepID=UPI00344C84F2|nr:hypothetical protein [Clostridium sp.]